MNLTKRAIKAAGEQLTLGAIPPWPPLGIGTSTLLVPAGEKLA